MQEAETACVNLPFEISIVLTKVIVKVPLMFFTVIVSTGAACVEDAKKEIAGITRSVAFMYLELNPRNPLGIS